MKLKKILCQVGLIVFMGAAIGLILRFPLLSEYGAGEFLREDAVSEEYPGILYITLAEAEDLFSTRSAFFIDSRQADLYHAGHIFGAVNVPYGADDTDLLLADWERPLDETLVVYCDGEECRSSVLLAQMLYDAGFLDVRIFFGGWVEWLGAGLPVEGDYAP